MNCLLDTHVIIWYFEDSQRLPQRITELIDSFETGKYISMVSLWEIAIKINLGKLELKLSFDELLNLINSANNGILQIEDDYLKLLIALPDIHKDPFDRLIIASAIAEDLTIITTDENIQKYDVKWIW